MSNSNSRRSLIVGLLVTLLLPAAASAQKVVIIERNVNLREDPSTEHPPIRLLKPPAKLALVNDQQEDGYYEVRTAEGEEGWVWANNVRIEGGTLAITAAVYAKVRKSSSVSVYIDEKGAC